MTNEQLKMAPRAQVSRRHVPRREQTAGTLREKGRKGFIYESGVIFAMFTQSSNVICIHVYSMSGPLMERREGTDACFIAALWWDFRKKVCGEIQEFGREGINRSALSNCPK